MRHRGPDSGGVHTQPPVSLVFRRLAIIDLSPDGNQPMCNEDETVWIVFNGEIYNYPALRAELQGKHTFRSKTDTETLIHGFEEWGFEGLLSRIDGMFAIALWDSKSQELFLARDRTGKKPLYWSLLPDGEGIAFSSTLNSLMELLPARPPIDPIALDEYLIYQAVPAPRTIYSGVSMLPPAHGARYTLSDGFKSWRYWSLSYAKKVRRREADLLEELDSLVRAAVERRLLSDVPLGAFLSGGVDSSLIVGIMSSLGAGPVKTVTIGFDDPRFDERPYARLVAERWKCDAHEHVLPADEVQNLPRIVWHYGQPHADVSIVPTYAVARCAREQVTVILNGDGGDEGFGGYARPLVARAANLVRGVPDPLLSLTTLLGKRGKILARAARQSGRESFIYERGLRNLRTRLYAPEFLERLAGRDPDEHYRAAWDSADGLTDADKALFGDLTTYLPDQLLVKMDVSTMAHSVEGRSPLLDTRLLEFAATIPVEQLTHRFQTKYLLKRVAERYVPGEVLYRRKQGFVMPTSRWLRGELAPLAEKLLHAVSAPSRGLFVREPLMQLLAEHQSGQYDWGNQLWTLIVLEIWHRLFVEGTLSPDTPLNELLDIDAVKKAL